MISGDDCSNFPKFTIWFSVLILYQMIIRYERMSSGEAEVTASIGYYVCDTLLSSLDCSESLSPPKDRLKDHHICRQ